jgi:hypothetical protein
MLWISHLEKHNSFFLASENLAMETEINFWEKMKSNRFF